MTAEEVKLGKRKPVKKMLVVFNKKGRSCASEVAGLWIRKGNYGAPVLKTGEAIQTGGSTPDFGVTVKESANSSK